MGCLSVLGDTAVRGKEAARRTIAPSFFSPPLLPLSSPPFARARSAAWEAGRVLAPKPTPWYVWPLAFIRILLVLWPLLKAVTKAP